MVVSKRISFSLIVGILCVICFMTGCTGTAKSNEAEEVASAEDTSIEATEEVSPVEDDVAVCYSVGDTVSTDKIEFTLTDVAFADKVGLDSSDWLKPTNGMSGLSAGDGSIYVWMSLDVKNLSKEEISGYDVTNIVAEYDDGYTYDDATWTGGNYGWSTNNSTSQNVGLPKIMPLQSDEIYGYIRCASAVRDDRDKPLFIKVLLPSSNGYEEFLYEYALSDGADTSEEALAASEAFANALDELAFVEKYAGNTNEKGSRKFADERVDALRNSLSPINVDYVNENLPEVATALPDIQTNIYTICDLLVDMGQTNSDANVPEIKRLCSETSDSINTLLQDELNAFN